MFYNEYGKTDFANISVLKSLYTFKSLNEEANLVPV